MKRVTLIGTCVLAVCAVGAIAASSAAAGEYGECYKVAKGETGKYTNSTCTTTGEGKSAVYNWRAVGTKDKPFTGTDTNSSLKTEVGEIKCPKSKLSGEILGWQKNEETLTFEKCELVSPILSGKCSSEGQKSGKIVTNKLDSYLIDHGTIGPSGLEPKEGEVWNELESSEHEPYLGEFECAGVKFRVSGTISGVFSPVNTVITKGTLTLAEKEGEQDLQGEYSTTNGASWVGPFSGLLLGKEELKFKSKIEIRACNEVGGVKGDASSEPSCEHEELPLPWNHGTS